MQYSRPHRRAAVLAAALVCLVLVMLFSGAIARGMILRLRASRFDQRQVQCFWLAESAADRAAAQLEADPEYAGETWQVSIPQQGSALTGVADIRVEPVGDSTDQRRVFIQARWPDDPVDGVVRRTEFTIAVPSPGATP